MRTALPILAAALLASPALAQFVATSAETISCGNAPSFIDPTASMVPVDPADFNFDGQVNQSDLLDFVNAVTADNLIADLDRNNIIEGIDVARFLEAYTDSN